VDNTKRGKIQNRQLKIFETIKILFLTWIEPVGNYRASKAGKHWKA